MSECERVCLQLQRCLIVLSLSYCQHVFPLCFMQVPEGLRRFCPFLLLHCESVSNHEYYRPPP